MRKISITISSVTQGDSFPYWGSYERINMFNIQLYNKIAKVGTDNFDTAKYNVGEDIQNPDAIMVRSAAMHDMEFGAELKAIARAGAGVNNIPVDRCSDAGIVVFNTPGANANAVKELVVCGLMLASRDIIEGAAWAKGLTDNADMDVAKQVEKGKGSLPAVKLRARSSVSSVWAPSVRWLQTQRRICTWRFSASTSS